VLLTQYFSVDKIEKTEMCGACKTHGGEERRVETCGKETTWENQAWMDDSKMDLQEVGFGVWG